MIGQVAIHIRQDGEAWTWARVAESGFILSTGRAASRQAAQMAAELAALEERMVGEPRSFGSTPCGRRISD